MHVIINQAAPSLAQCHNPEQALASHRLERDLLTSAQQLAPPRHDVLLGISFQRGVKLLRLTEDYDLTGVIGLQPEYFTEGMEFWARY